MSFHSIEPPDDVTRSRVGAVGNRVGTSAPTVRPAASRAAAFIDPYWIGGESVPPSPELLRRIARTAGPRVRIARVYWYLEQEGVPRRHTSVPRVTVRVTASDDLDDGYELVRAVDADLRAIASSKAYDTVILSSLDDRLALTLEWVKSHGITVIGCASHADEADQRMLRVIDELIEVRANVGSATVQHGGESDEVSADATTAIESAVTQWREDADAETSDRTRQFVATRPGLPRLVDSRLLFLTSKQLGRELSAPERILLRKTFRERLSSS